MFKWSFVIYKEPLGTLLIREVEIKLVLSEELGKWRLKR